MAQKKNFSAEMRQPFPEPKIGILMNDEGALAALEACNAEADQRLAEYSAHYQTPPGDYRSLAIALIKDLAVKNPAGRSKKWDDMALGALFVEVERLLNDPSDPAVGISQAVTKLAKQEHWRSFLDQMDSTGVRNEPEEALRRRYYQATRERMGRIMMKAYKHDPVEGWEQILRLCLQRDEKKL
jgi:hypothetical protein